MGFARVQPILRRSNEPTCNSSPPRAPFARRPIAIGPGRGRRGAVLRTTIQSRSIEGLARRLTRIQSENRCLVLGGEQAALRLARMHQRALDSVVPEPD